MALSLSLSLSLSFFTLKQLFPVIIEINIEERNYYLLKRTWKTDQEDFLALASFGHVHSRGHAIGPWTELQYARDLFSNFSHTCSRDLFRGGRVRSGYFFLQQQDFLF